MNSDPSEESEEIDFSGRFAFTLASLRDAILFVDPFVSPRRSIVRDRAATFCLPFVEPAFDI